MSVREIRGWTEPTPLPHAPAHVRGVINLRGTVLPVIDLAHRLGMAPLTGNARNVIIVVQAGDQLTGLLVDAVSDIIVLPKSSLQQPPSVASGQTGGSVAALTVTGGRMLRILDPAMVIQQAAVLAA
jgi:purine-binding chemotaxis protein CheW